MAAYIYREDIKRLFLKAVHKFESESGLKYHEARNKKKFLDTLTKKINAIPHKQVSSRFLQKKIVSEIWQNFSAVCVTIDLDDLNALYAYVKDDTNAEYENEYLVGNNETDLLIAGLKKVSAIENSISKLMGVDLPEFPVDNANYPSNPNIPFYYKDFQKIWIKDESHNVTGTFKDRWAWEILKYYRAILENFKKEKKSHLYIPRLCLISSGCAAISLQYLLNKFRLPGLKVILDQNIDKAIEQALKNLGAEPKKHNLDLKELSVAEIKKILVAKDWDIDITLLNQNEELKVKQFEFYDWLSIEILNQNPDYCFIPFGSGLLFHNILEMAKQEVISAGTGKRFLGDFNRIKNCTFYGAKPKTNNRDTLLDKLYAKHNPSSEFDIESYKGDYCNAATSIVEVDEKFVKESLKLTKDYTEHSIIAEPSGLAGLSLFLQMENSIPKDSKIVIVNTGKLKTEKFIR